MPTLRDYQASACEQTLAKLRAACRPILVLPTGAGKSVCAQEIANRFLDERPGARVLFLAHRRELVVQLASHLERSGLRVGIIKAGFPSIPELPVQVASVQTLSSRELPAADLLVWDECFVAGTLVDGRPIEQIAASQAIMAYDETRGTFQAARVTCLIRRPAPPVLYRITAGGRSVVCTGNHPFYSPCSGWITAGQLTDGDYLYVLPMRSRVEVQEEHQVLGVLQPGHGAAESRNGTGKDAAAQPDVDAWSSGPGAAQVDRPTDSQQRRERPRSNQAAEADGRCVGMADRVIDYDRNQVDGTADPLQAGCGQSDREGVHRNRWTITPPDESAGGRPQEGSLPDLARVDRAEVFQRGRDAEFDRLCPDGVVYNLSVEPYHTYNAGGFVVHNCHHLLARTFKRISDHYATACQLGLTATPWRLDGRGLGGVFTDIVVGAYADDLCRQKYLVEPRVYAPPAASLSGVHTRAGDYVRSELARAMDVPKLVADVVATWQKHARGVPSIGFAVNCEHSRHLVAQFVAAGIRAEHCDGETPSGEREAILARLASGQTEVVWNVDLFGEGFDLPKIKCVVMARATQSMALYYQWSGRAMRPTPDGGPAIVLDHAGLVHRFGRVTQRLEYSLEGIPEKERTTAGGSGLKTCPNCFRMVLQHRKVCPECGTSLLRDQELPEFEKGELVAVNDTVGEAAPVPQVPPITSEQDQEWRYLEETRIESDRKPDWSVAEFRRRFGRNPTVVTVDGVRVLATPHSTEATRNAAWLQFKAEAQARGKFGRAMYAYAAARCQKLFGSVPAAAKHRAKENRKAKVMA